MTTSHNPYAPRVKASEAPVEAENTDNKAELEETPTETVEGSESVVPDGPAAEVLEWVGTDKDRAKTALEAEEAGQQRVGLTKKLKELAE